MSLWHKRAIAKYRQRCCARATLAQQEQQQQQHRHHHRHHYQHLNRAEQNTKEQMKLRWFRVNCEWDYQSSGYFTPITCNEYDLGVDEHVHMIKRTSFAGITVFGNILNEMHRCIFILLVGVSVLWGKMCMHYILWLLSLWLHLF